MSFIELGNKEFCWSNGLRHFQDTSFSEKWSRSTFGDKFPQGENETDFQRQQTMVTRHSHTIGKHGQTWLAIKNHDTMVKLLPG